MNGGAGEKGTDGLLRDVSELKEALRLESIKNRDCDSELNTASKLAS